MNKFLQKVYDELAAEHWDLSERQFSKQYLGKCETYFAYLKSTGKEPSADAMLKLWGKLNREKELYESNLQLAQSSIQKQYLVDWVALYSGLSGEVFGVIANVTSMPH